jgi:c-di-GMP-binding flagellar brake protein YcgR
VRDLLFASQRANMRFSVQLKSALRVGELDLRGTSVDISKGGARIVLPGNQVPESKAGWTGQFTLLDEKGAILFSITAPI